MLLRQDLVFSDSQVIFVHLDHNFFIYLRGLGILGLFPMLTFLNSNLVNIALCTGAFAFFGRISKTEIAG